MIPCRSRCVSATGFVSRYPGLPRAIHFPESIEEVDMARRRLLYEELLFLELQLITEQREHALQFPGFEQGADEALVNELAQVLPFELTREQAGARDEIWVDMAAPKAMDRLLLGDVGTGKTIVAFCALVCAARATLIRRSWSVLPRSW